MENIAKRVNEIVVACLYTDAEINKSGSEVPSPIAAQGIMRDFGFYPDRIEQHKPEIKMILDEMPQSFHKSGGGGMSFLNLCMDKNDNHWGEHSSMEALVVLAIAAGYGQYCMPKEMWSAFPGGMPYVVFNTNGD